MSIRLSICIPTYNRKRFLPDLLSSLIDQDDEELEVVICDNGSTDGTEALVAEWKKKYPKIVYERFPRNVGPDRCFLRSVEMASGEFCWLMGDDDIIEPGGIQRVLEAIKGGITGITLNRAAYNFTLEKRWLEPSFGREEDRLFLNAQECFYSLFTLFGFLSSQVVKRSAWLAIAEEEDLTPYFNAYALVYIIGRMIQKEPRWLYLHTPCVGWRSGNDSFAEQLGNYGRFELDVCGYVSIAGGLFYDQDKLYKEILGKVLLSHLFGRVRDLKFRSKGFTFSAIRLCVPLLYNIYSFWFALFPALCAPRFLWKLGRPLYRYNLKLKKQRAALN